MLQPTGSSAGLDECGNYWNKIYSILTCNCETHRTGS